MSVAAAVLNPLQDRLIRRFYSIPICGNRIKLPLFSNTLISRAHVPHLQHLASLQKKTHSSGAPRWRIEAFVYGEGVDGSPRRDMPGQLSLDAVLSIAEVLCIAPAMVFSIGSIVCLVFPGMPKPFRANLGNVFFGWQFFLLVGAVAIGSLIRWRQYQRIYSYNGAGVNLIVRIEKVEEDLRSMTTIVRVLSRQLEKLGIRFRVLRKALKEPIVETTALAHKNAEATRALAVQEDILEKELGEIQKVLLAMQEQQQKQLELILAIGKAGRLLESKRETSVGKSGPVLEKDTSVLVKKDVNQKENQTTSNDRV